MAETNDAAGAGGLVRIGNLAGLEKPLTRVIDLLGAAGAAVFEPKRIERRAKAEANALVVMAEGRAAANAIEVRAHRRLETEAVRQQDNLESIAARAGQLLPQAVTETKVDPDWVFHFVEESKNTSNQEMQEFWARLLAGEMESPGSFSKRTISSVRLMDPSDARLFATVCQFTIAGGRVSVIGDNSEFLVARGLSFIALQNLEAVGLIKHQSPLANYATEYDLKGKSPAMVVVAYFDRRVLLDVSGIRPTANGRTPVNTGKVMLSNLGKEIQKLVETRPSQAIFEYMVEVLRKGNPQAVITVEDPILTGPPLQ